MRPKFKSIRVDDLIVLDEQIWVVTGCYHSTDPRLDVIGLRTRDSKVNDEYMVPLDMIPAAAIFRAVDHVASGPVLVATGMGAA